MVAFTSLALSSLLLLASTVDASKKCRKPSVRREWGTLSDTERAEWITAVKCLGNAPRDGTLTPTVDPAISLIPPVNTTSFYYDDFSYVHMDLNVKIHFTGFFLPWHRAYLNAFEAALQDKCGYKGTQPYWDWSLHTDDFFNDPIFDPSLTSGFGGNGDPNDDLEVKDGGFANDFVRAYPTPHTIRRNFTVNPWFNPKGSLFANGELPPQDFNKLAVSSITPSEVKKLVTGFEGDFEGFQTYMEGFQGAHAAVHLTISGDMLGLCPNNALPPACYRGPKWSANDPLFFMHHAMVDKVWSDWQNRRDENFWSFHGGSVQPLQNVSIYEQFPNGEPAFLNLHSPIPADGMFPEYSVYDVLDTTAGPMCYVYE